MIDGRLPYKVIERMIVYATPHQGEIFFNMGAGDGLTRLLNILFPNSLVVDDSGHIPPLSEIAHTFNKVFIYSPTLEIPRLIEAADLIVQNGSIITASSLSKSWYQRETSVRKKLEKMLEEKGWPTSSSELVVDKSGYFMVARFSPLIPDNAVAPPHAYERVVSLARCLIQKPFNISLTPELDSFLEIDRAESDLP